MLNRREILELTKCHHLYHPDDLQVVVVHNGFQASVHNVEDELPVNNTLLAVVKSDDEPEILWERASDFSGEIAVFAGGDKRIVAFHTNGDINAADLRLITVLNNGRVQWFSE